MKNIIFPLLILLTACGEQYRKEAQSLLLDFYKMAAEYGMCRDVQDCRKKELAFMEGGGKIYINMYGIDDPEFIAKTAEIALINSSSIYQGIPIVVSVYKTSKQETQFFQKPFYKMEIK